MEPWLLSSVSAQLPPPKKIACGLFHSASICNHVKRGDKTVFLTSKFEDEDKSTDKSELYVWGRCSNNVLGALPTKNPGVDRHTPEKVDRENFLTRNAGEGYEVACGVNHTLYSIRRTVKGKETADLFGFGLGDHGRLGVPDKSIEDSTKAGSESWYTEKHARKVEFSFAYQVYKLEETKAEGVDYFESVAAYSVGKENNKGVYEWDSIVHLVEAEEDGWFKVEGNFDGPRLMQMSRWLKPFKIDVLRICCGSDHSLCLVSSGWLFAWGLNDDGQCGVGGDLGADKRCVWKPTPVCFAQSAGLVTHFAAGACHSLMLQSSGRLYSWGCSKQGRLGLGYSGKSQSEPQNVVMKHSDMSFIYVDCGEAHSGAIDNQGDIWMWGAGAHGRLGLGETIDVPTPRLVEVLDEVTVKQLSLGGFHSVALTNKPHKVFSWGMGHAVGQSMDGEGLSFTLPQNVSIIDHGEDLAPQVTQVAAGIYHTLFLLKDGRLASCGLGLSGRLGQGTLRNIGIPKLVNGHCGFALQLKGDAALMKFKHTSEQPPADDKKKDEMEGHEGKKKWNLKQIGCGSMSSVALTYGGSVYVWGDNHYGQLGLKGKNSENVWMPKRLAFGQPVKGIAVGFEHCLAYTVFGLYVWGKGESGQLGLGRTHNQMEPALIEDRYFGNTGSGVKIIGCAAGDDHSCAIISHTDSSALYSWGNSEMGKLGIKDKTLEQYLRPTKVECDFDKKFPVVVVCGPYHTALIVAEDVDDKEGELWMFGGGTYGRLGVKENQHNIDSPMQVKWPQVGTSAVGPCTAVACGSYHTCALTRDTKRDTTELFVWGHRDAMCEVEHAVTPKRFSLIEGAVRFKYVACNASHSFVIAESGEVYAWGKNRHGQLAITRGDEIVSKIDKPELLKVIPGSVEMLATGPQHAMALMSNGNMFAWGTQSCGRLGLESKKSSRIVTKPAMVKAEWASIEEITTATEQGKTTDAFADDDDYGSEHGKGDEVAGEAAGNQTEKAQEGDETFEKSMIDSLKSGQKVQLFATMQSLLKNEPEASRETTFKKVEEDLSSQLRGYLQDIRDLPEKEKEIQHAVSDLGVALSATVRHIRNGKLKPPDFGKMNEKILVQMKNYESLMWVLQQQPCYLSTLSMCGLQGNDLEMFYKVIECLYKDLEDSRTLNLFMALLKMLIAKEVEHAKDLGEVFNKLNSRVFRIFSHFALQPLHYQRVVYPIMRHRTEEELELLKKHGGDPIKAFGSNSTTAKETKEERHKHSIFRRICDASLSQVFALSEEGFRKNPINKTDEMDREEMQAKFLAQLDGFKEFMQNDFLEGMRICDLHPNVQTILSHSLRTIQGRKFPEQIGDQRIAEDLLVCQPLLSLIVGGILERMLSDQSFSGPAVGLPIGNMPKDLDAQAVHNSNVVCEFLTNMVEGKYEEIPGKQALPPAERVLVAISRILKPALLKYVQEQAAHVDKVETQLIIDVFTTHFDVKPRRVSVPTSPLMTLSNLLITNENKLRQCEDDVMESICKNIGTWSEEEIGAVKQKGDLLHNFVINHRFLTTTDTELTICRASQCPMPPRLCSTCVRDAHGFSVIQTYAVDMVDQPWKLLEEIFREMNEVKATTFGELAKELESMLKEATVKTPPNYALAHRISGGIARVKDMEREDQSERDVLRFMSDKLLSRSKHQAYLEQVQKGIHQIRKAKLNHELQLTRYENGMKQMVTFATGLVLPDKLQKAISEGGELPALEKYSKRQRMTRSTDLTKLGGSKFLPSKTFTYKEMRQRDVLTEDIKNLPPDWKRSTTIKFTSTSEGGVGIEVGVKQKKSVNTLRSIKLDADKVRELRRAPEGSTIMLPESDDPAPLVFNSTALSQLITKLMET